MSVKGLNINCKDLIGTEIFSNAYFSTKTAIFFSVLNIVINLMALSMLYMYYFGERVSSSIFAISSSIFVNM